MTQCERILRHIKKHGRITMMTAYEHLGITCCSQRITDLRKTHNILTRYATSPTGARYAVWSLAHGPKKQKVCIEAVKF